MDKEILDPIEAANSEFYKSLEAGSIERLEDIWLHEDWVRLVHPGWGIITGWKSVRETLKSMVEEGYKFKVSPSEIWVQRTGDFAWVTCTENITVFMESNFDSVQAIATNLFKYHEGHWLMVHHHATPIPVILNNPPTDVIQ
jgi:ketosteroid isomerase-like protein